MRAITVPAVLMLLASCAKGEKPATPALDSAAATAPSTPAATGVSRATAAAALANAIAANPEKADSILGAAGYNADSFQKLMYEIAADSAMSAEYAAARTK